MELKVQRYGGRFDKSELGYTVEIYYGYDGDYQDGQGFISGEIEIIVPLEAGEGLTIHQLYEEAFRRFDEMKHLL